MNTVRETSVGRTSVKWLATAALALLATACSEANGPSDPNGDAPIGGTASKMDVAEATDPNANPASTGNASTVWGMAMQDDNPMPTPSQQEMDPLDMAGTGAPEPILDPIDPMDPMMPVDPMVDMMPEPVTEPPMRADLGEGDGSDVITVGDSWMNSFVNGIQQSLLRVSGQPYRTYGVGGTRLLSGQIPGQYDDAKRANPDIKTVIMTGGGNDIIQVPGLRDDCDAMGELCAEEVGKILEGLSGMWTEMAADGVQDVIYVQYSDPEGNDVDFALPDGDGVIPRCANVPEPLRCHRLETNAIVMQDIPDGIHPSAAGFDRIAEAVYDMMVERGMRR